MRQQQRRRTWYLSDVTWYWYTLLPSYARMGTTVIRLQGRADPDIGFEGRPCTSRCPFLGAEGLNSETPKATRRWGMGRGIPFTANWGIWGSVVSSPTKSRRSPGRNLICVKSECQRSHLVARISLNFLQQFHSCTICHKFGPFLPPSYWIRHCPTIRLSKWSSLVPTPI